MTTAATAPLGLRATLLTVLVPFGFGYYFSYLFRTVNAVISPQLSAEFALGAGDLGLLTSIYFFAFALTQIPLGIALDRYGPRRVQAALMVVAAAGAVVFAVGTDFTMVAIGRGLIGAGVSGALMAAVQANSLWWPRDRLPLVNGLMTMFGGSGAITATAPLEALLGFVGWREVFWGIAALTVACALLIYLVVPERHAEAGPRPSAEERRRLFRAVIRDGFFWRLTLMFVSVHAAFQSYQTLWAAPWLRDVAGFDRVAVANHLLLIQVGFFAGGVAAGMIADRLRLKGIAPLTVFIGILAVFFVVQAFVAAGAAGFAALLWLAWGLVGAATLLCFSIFPQLYPPAITGRVITLVNLMMFVFSFAFQWGVGVVIDQWAVLPGGRFDPEAHGAAMLILMAIEAFFFVVFLARYRVRRGARAS